jgi:16S rRNA (adenine1518-N6/adenine1519-N6)-dimethyltransferase
MKQRLGQNFLIDKKVAEREIGYANIKQNDIVLEIGPGKGILTEILAKKAKKIIAIELDKNLFNNLKSTIPENVELICGDVLKADFEELPKFNKVVSNIPFQISSPLTFKLLEYDFSLAVMIYQKEFAGRMIAVPGSKNYSRLSVSIYYKTNCESLGTVSKMSFSPQPKVDSCIIRLIPRKNPPVSVVDEKLFFDLTKNLFNHRRKKIKNIINEFYKIPLKEIPYQDNRIENLTPEQIGKLSNVVFKLLSY